MSQEEKPGDVGLPLYRVYWTTNETAELEWAPCVSISRLGYTLARSFPSSVMKRHFIPREEMRFACHSEAEALAVEHHELGRRDHPRVFERRETLTQMLAQRGWEREGTSWVETKTNARIEVS